MFTQTKDMDVNLVTAGGCNLGEKQESIKVYFSVTSVITSPSGSSATVFAGIDQQNIQFYGQFPVEINVSSGVGILEQAEEFLVSSQDFAGSEMA